MTTNIVQSTETLKGRLLEEAMSALGTKRT